MAVMLVLLMEGIMKCMAQMDSGGMIYVRSLMKIGKGVKRILRFCFSNLKAVMLVLLLVGINVVHR
jgi:hypothetical protein